MDDRSIVVELLRGGAFVILTAAVIVAGWNEPLSYLFMKPGEIHAEERSMFPEPEPVAPEPWRPQGTALDRAPYRSYRNELQYTGNFDSRKMGTRSETDRREHVYGGKR